MSVNPSGSPTLRRSGTRSSSQENAGTEFAAETANSLKKSSVALSSNKLGNQAPKKLKTNHESAESATSKARENPMDKLLAKLSEQTAELSKQQAELKASSTSETDIAFARTVEYVATTTAAPAPVDTAPEVLRLKLELETAKARIARMDQELAQSRQSAEPVPSPADFYGNQGSAFPTYRPQSYVRDNSWAQEDTLSDTSDALSAGGYNRARAIWSQPAINTMGSVGPGYAGRGPRFNGPPVPAPGFQGLPYSRGNSFDGMQGGSQSSHGHGHGIQGSGLPRGVASFIGGQIVPPSMYAYQPTPIGTPLSPTAPEFTAGGWKNDAVAIEGQTYLPTTEPLNYRRLLDRTVNCNWKYIVDKIVCNNDQQASIFLQQKLKVGTTEQKYDIVEAIVAQAYPLMVNRFGNFLVQRCFEHGTPEQVIKIAEAIRGNTLNLSMDAFGCHVVQKAFDSVPEDYKAIMVHELLRRIPETVIHRYACHVWQKLFELRWTESPPQIMKYVNDALCGMWHEVALGETGSLVVQNIFENCLEEDKRPCIEEVLASIDIVAHGQFGNWCIQHICEHGAPADRSRAIDHVIRYASEYSMDQFASKVVEKCLKIGGIDFLGRYLDRVCEGRHDRPRIPLIDIASDQYGNYLIQYILTHSNPQHREIVAQHIRKHMVSLRGSKFGSRVGMLCTNPAIQTRPGPGSGSAIGAPNPRLPPQNPRFAGGYR